MWMSMHRCKTVEAHSVDGWESSLLPSRQIPDIMRVGRVLGRLLDYAELEGSLRAALEQGRVHPADLGVLVGRVAPDQLVDLDHLPVLRLLAAGGVVLDHDIRAGVHIVAAVLPALERGAQEARGDIFVLGVLEPVGAREDTIL